MSLCCAFLFVALILFVLDVVLTKKVCIFPLFSSFSVSIMLLIVGDDYVNLVCMHDT